MIRNNLGVDTALETKGCVGGSLCASGTDSEDTGVASCFSASNFRGAGGGFRTGTGGGYGERSELQYFLPEYFFTCSVASVCKALPDAAFVIEERLAAGLGDAVIVGEEAGDDSLEECKISQD